MSRGVFAVVMPLIAAVILCILGVNTIAAGFAGEGCRFHDGAGLRWRAASETALVQLLFGVGFSLALGVQSAILRARETLQARAPQSKALEFCAIIGFLLLATGLILEQAACRTQPIYSIAKVPIWTGVIALAVYHVLLLAAYIKGLAKGP